MIWNNHLMVAVMHLMLFSGKKDSVNDLLNFIHIRKVKEIGLLYIIGAGFRNEYDVPYKIVSDIEKREKIKIHLWIADAKRVQNKLMMSISNDLSDITVVDLCAICQFVLNFVYVQVANRLGMMCLYPDINMFSQSFMKLIMLPYEYNKDFAVDKGYFINRNKVNSHLSSFALENAGMKCQLSSFHNYNFNEKTLNITSKMLEKAYCEMNNEQIEVFRGEIPVFD